MMKNVASQIGLPNNIKQIKKESLDKLCQDSKIKAFMQTHHMTRLMIDDYWIELLNYQEDYQMCIGCESIQNCPKNMKGYQRQLISENGRISLDMQPCTFEIEHAHHLAVLSRIQPCNMPYSIFDIPFKELSITSRSLALNTMLNYIKEPSDKGIYLHGAMQNGKTTVMAAFIYELAQKGKQCAFINVPNLIGSLKEQFSSSNNSSELLISLKNVDVLVLDDIGGENASPWSRDEVLAAIVNERSLKKIPTFFTSVYSLEELKKYYVLSKQIGDKLKVERLIEKMKAVSVEVELKSSKFFM